MQDIPESCGKCCTFVILHSQSCNKIVKNKGYENKSNYRNHFHRSQPSEVAGDVGTASLEVV
jgi:hypothetical protein